MIFYIGVTDYIWFHFLARHWPEELNFWWPRDKADFKVIDEGVHSTLGSGFQEVICQRAMAIEMTKQKLAFEREMEMEIFYEKHLIGNRRIDFFVEDKIMVELKAVSALEDQHLAQAMNYCQAYNLPIGLLINFGSRSLEYKRVYNVNHPENR